MAKSKKPKARPHRKGSKGIRSSKASTPSTANPWKSIPIKKEFALPAEVKRAFHLLDDAGFVVYFVGGCVRDFLLSRTPKDFDLVTDATPDEILGLFPDGLDVGKKFGVIKISPQLEVATFRADGEYLDGRHPEDVTFGDPFSDVLRRDFTVNGLLLDFKTKRVLDAVGGVDDLQKGILRAIGDPLVRLEEDALRILRAVRFSTRFAFPLESELRTALSVSAKRLRKISSERIRDEMQMILLGDHAARGFMTLRELGVIPEILPEAERLGEKVWKAFERMLDEKNSARNVDAVLWSLLFFGVGREEQAKKLQSLCDRFRLSTALRERISFIISEQHKFKEVFEMREARLFRWVREPAFLEALELHRIFARARDGNMMAYEFCKGVRARVESRPEFKLKLLSGDDLIELGLPPGKRFAQILAEVEDLQFEGKITSKDEAIEFVIERYVE